MSSLYKDQIVYFSKSLGLYGFVFHKLNEALLFFKRIAKNSDILKIFLLNPSNMKYLSVKEDECLFIPLLIESCERLIRVVAKFDVLALERTFIKSQNIKFELPGVPAVVNEDIGMLFRNYLQFSFQLIDLYSELGYEKDNNNMEYFMDNTPLYFISFSSLLRGFLEPTIVHEGTEIFIFSTASADANHSLVMDSSNVEVTFSTMYATAEKPKDHRDMIQTSNPSGVTTVAASMSSRSAESEGNIEATDDQPRKRPINEISQSNKDESLSKMIERYAKMKYLPMLWETLNESGWFIEEAVWSSKWWNCELVYIPPRQLGKSNEAKKLWVPGKDFFWCLEDVSACIKRYGYSDTLLGKCKFTAFTFNYNDSSWNLNRRIHHILNEGCNVVEKNRIPYLLQKTGWKILNPSNKIPAKDVYVPYWTADKVGVETITSFTLYVDYFIDLDSVMSYIKTNGNCKTQLKRQSPRDRRHDIEDSAPENIVSPKKGSKNSLEDEVIALVRQSSNFGEVWAALKRLGWKHLNTDATYIKATSVYVPSWVNVGGKSKFPAGEMEENRDFFVGAIDLIRYISKHGLRPTTKHATPTDNVQRARKAPLPFEINHAKREILRHAEPVRSPASSLTQSSDNMSEYSLETQAKKLANTNPAKRYVFPELWTVLREAGWRSVYGMNEPYSQVYMPNWTKVKRESTKYGVLHVDLSGLVPNCDYFLDKVDVIDHIKKYGIQRGTIDDKPNGSNAQKHFTKTQSVSSMTVSNAPPVQHVDEDNSSCATDATNNFAKEIACLDPTKHYVFPRLWELLRSHGWKCLYHSHDSFVSLYIPSWTNLQGLYGKDNRHIDPTGLKINEDYFCEKNEIIDYVKIHGLRPCSKTSAAPAMTSNQANNDSVQVVEPIHDDRPLKRINKENSPNQSSIRLNHYQKEIHAWVNNPHNSYLFPSIWENLKKFGWKLGFLESVGNEYAYLPPWTVRSLVGVKFEEYIDDKFLLRNKDYFTESAQLMEYLKDKSILKKMELLPNDEQEANINNEYLNDPRHSNYRLPVISPRKTVVSKQSQGYDDIDYFHQSLADMGYSPLIDFNNNNELTPNSTQSTCANTIVEYPKCWIGLPLKDVIRNAISLRFNGDRTSNVIGREEEYTKLLSLIKQSFEEGHGMNILLHGQPGQGKSLMVNCMSEELHNFDDIPEFTFIKIQATVASDLFGEIAKKLHLTNVSNVKQSVLNHFSSSPIRLQTTQNSSQSKRMKTNRIPMTILVIEEACKGKVDDIRLLLEIAGGISSSLIVLGLFNNCSFYDNLNLPSELYERIDVPAYSTDNLIDIAKYYTSNLLDEAAAKYIGMNCYRNESSDIRFLRKFCLKCLEDYADSINSEDNNIKYDGSTLINFGFIRNLTSSINNAESRYRKNVLSALNSQSMRILVAMYVEDVGVDSFVSPSAIKFAYEAFTERVSFGELNHFGESVESSLIALSEQNFLISSGSKSKKTYKLQISAEDLIAANENNPSYLRHLNSAVIQRQSMEE